MSLFGRPNVEKLRHKRDVEGLIKALGNKDALIQGAAAQILGELGDARAVEPLVETLREGGWLVGGAAAKSLGELGDPRAIEPLALALSDEDERLRTEAALALAKLGDPRAVEPLVEALGGDPRVEEALQRIGLPEAERALAAEAAASSAIETLVELCADPPLTRSGMDDMLAEAGERLGVAGARGSRALAGFIQRLMDVRSSDIDWPLWAARRAEVTPELVSAVRAVLSAPAVRTIGRLSRTDPIGSRNRRFTPEIVGDGKIGWTDATRARIAEVAQGTLDVLSGEGEAPPN
jgi:HEAT repeat protein